MDGDFLNEIIGGISKLIITLLILCIIFIPLGLWKAIELILTWIK